MSFSFETYVDWPLDPLVEKSLVDIVKKHGGILEFIEDMHVDGAAIAVELTFDFIDEASAQAAEREVQQAGYHTEGVGPYGPD